MEEWHMLEARWRSATGGSLLEKGEADGQFSFFLFWLPFNAPRCAHYEGIRLGPTSEWLVMETEWVDVLINGRAIWSIPRQH